MRGSDKRRPNHAWRARGELAHRVIEMSDRARASVEYALGFLRAGVRMAETHHDPGFRQAPDEVQGDRGGRERHHHHASARCDQRVWRPPNHRADELSGVHPLALGIDERPFDMDAERARNALTRLSRRYKRFVEAPAARRSRPSAERQSRQRADAQRRSRRFPRRRIGVEQHAAAAVDLPIDKPGAKNASA